MKKLLLLLFSMLVSLSSYGETIVCSGVSDLDDEAKAVTEVYKRVGDKFVYEKDEIDVYFDYFFEDNETGVLILQKFLGPSIYTVLINKNKLKARVAAITMDFVYGWEAKCQFID